MPAQRRFDFSARIFLESVAAVRERLARIAPNPRLLAERESIQVWTPLYEQLVGLFLETVNGESPTIVPDDEGRWVSLETRRFHIAGGWPCHHYPANWSERAILFVTVRRRKGIVAPHVRPVSARTQPGGLAGRLAIRIKPLLSVRSYFKARTYATNAAISAG